MKQFFTNPYNKDKKVIKTLHLVFFVAFFVITFFYVDQKDNLPLHEHPQYFRNFNDQ